MAKKLIVFDLDGTLTRSKTDMDLEMAQLLEGLLKIKKVAVISGQGYKRFQEQFISALKCGEELKNLFLFPTCGSSFYKYECGWEKVYANYLSNEDKEKIRNAFKKMYKELKYKDPDKVYGEVLEDRETSMAFSAYGQKAPLELKEVWDTKSEKRLKMIESLKKYILGFDIRIGGTTSIDVTKKGIDKGYGIRQMEKHLGVAKADMLFIGDKLDEGGNDYPVKREGVECIEVKDCEETKKIIRGILDKELIK